VSQSWCKSATAKSLCNIISFFQFIWVKTSLDSHLKVVRLEDPASLMMTLKTPDLWTELYQERRRLLEREYKTNVPSLDFDGFEKALNRLCNKYTSTGLSRLLRILHPTLNHVRSFSGAINSAAQNNMVASLVWSGLQVFIEVYKCQVCLQFLR
jgi:hypothetical protein